MSWTIKRDHSPLFQDPFFFGAIYNPCRICFVHPAHARFNTAFSTELSIQWIQASGKIGFFVDFGIEYPAVLARPF